MLLLPFILVAFAAGFSQSLRPGARPLDLARLPVGPVAVPPSRPALPPRMALAPSMDPPSVLPPAAAAPTPFAQATIVETEPTLATAAPPAEREVASAATDLAPVARPPVEVAIVAPPVSAAAAPDPVAVPAKPSEGPVLRDARLPAPEIAAVSVPDPAPSTTLPATANVCVAGPGTFAKSTAPPAIAPPRDPSEFGVALAAAALAQTREFVVYNDKYRRIAYPMGDVPSFYGVCTDVLIRAYRALSIDLQALVQQTRSGSGDPNIDHRRVDTLRRFFAANGQSIPITEFAEDYRPGDIVSYWRPQNRHSRTHIAIVANEVGPSGRPMIIHNRGWGPQLEDGLFVDQITGHYRFTGLRAASAPTLPPGRRARPAQAAALPANAAH